MTNEEKAREIAADGDLLSNNPNKPRPFYHDLYVGAMQMAEWKDEQHKQELIRIYNFVSPYLTPEAINDLKIIIGLC